MSTNQFIIFLILSLFNIILSYRYILSKIKIRDLIDENNILREKCSLLRNQLNFKILDYNILSAQKVSSIDDKTQKLIALAADPNNNSNEAKNAALQACKRLAKK